MAFTAMAALFSCTEKSTYEPGPQASGAQYYFSADQATAVTINQATKTVSVDVFRVETAAASTATVSIADESGLISSAASATATMATITTRQAMMSPYSSLKIPIVLLQSSWSDSIRRKVPRGHLPVTASSE